MLIRIALRVLRALALMALISFLAYWLLRSVPGEPLAAMLDALPDLSSDDRARLRGGYGLDAPVLLGYFPWAAQVLRGDFGQIVFTQRGASGEQERVAVPVTNFILPRLQNTLILAGAAVGAGMAAVLVLGFLSGAGRRHGIVRTSRALGVVGSSFVGGFPLALMLIVVFSVGLHWLPPGGIMSSDVPPGLWNQLLDRAKHLVMPAFVLAFTELTAVARYAPSNWTFVAGSDQPDLHSENASGRVRPLWEIAVLNSLGFLVHILRLGAARVLAGTVVIEALFSYPGLGNLMYGAVMQNEFEFVVAVSAFLLLVWTALIGGLAADAIAWRLSMRIPPVPVRPENDTDVSVGAQGAGAPFAPASAGGAPGDRHQPPTTPQRFFQRPLAVVGLLLGGLLAAFAFLGPFFSPYQSDQVNLRERFARPSIVMVPATTEQPALYNQEAVQAATPQRPLKFGHPLGSDDLGRDTMTRAMHGARVSLIIGLVVALGGIVLSLVVGRVAGSLPHWGEQAVQWAKELQNALPDLPILLIMARTFALGIGIVWLALLALTLFRIERITHDFMPRALAVLCVSASLHAGWAVRAEAILSWLGLGLQPPTPSLGNMLSNSQQYFFAAPWLVFWPFLILFLTLLSFHLVAEGLRSAIEPGEFDQPSH